MKKIIIVSLLTAFFFSCKKEDQVCNLNSTSVEGSYRVTAVRYKADATSQEVDFYNQSYPDACMRDDLLRFNAGGILLFTDAGVQCNPPGDDTGTWSLNGNTIIIDGDARNVDNFNCSSMTVSITDVINFGDKITFVLTRQ